MNQCIYESIRDLAFSNQSITDPGFPNQSNRAATNTSHGEQVMHKRADYFLEAHGAAQLRLGFHKHASSTGVSVSVPCVHVPCFPLS